MVTVKNQKSASFSQDDADDIMIFSLRVTEAIIKLMLMEMSRFLNNSI